MLKRYTLGITDDVVFRSGNLEGLCTCGDLWFTHGLVGDKYVPQIVISNKAFSSKWIGGAYDLYYGYHPFAFGKKHSEETMK